MLIFQVLKALYLKKQKIFIGFKIYIKTYNKRLFFGIYLKKVHHSKKEEKNNHDILQKIENLIICVNYF